MSETLGLSGLGSGVREGRFRLSSVKSLLLAGCVSTSLLAGCATAPTDIAFNADAVNEQQSGIGEVSADEAILIIAIGAVGTGGGYDFRRINDDGMNFDSGPIYIGFGSWGIGDKMQRPADEKSSIWVLRDEINFLIKKVPAGRYAATQASWATFNGVSSGSAWLCRKEGATTFDIKPGAINLISSRDAFPPGIVTRISNAHSDEDVLAQFERTRQNYPDLKGDPVLVEPGWETRWSSKDGLFNDACNSVADGSMSLTPIHLRANDSAPDEAEQAAIAAALANIKKREAAPAPAHPKLTVPVDEAPAPMGDK